jgi:hypothetical protein
LTLRRVGYVRAKRDGDLRRGRIWRAKLLRRKRCNLFIGCIIRPFDFKNRAVWRLDFVNRRH